MAILPETLDKALDLAMSKLEPEMTAAKAALDATEHGTDERAAAVERFNQAHVAISLAQSNITAMWSQRRKIARIAASSARYAAELGKIERNLADYLAKFA